MTGPDRILIDRHGGNWSPVDGGTQDVEYIRRLPRRPHPAALEPEDGA